MTHLIRLKLYQLRMMNLMKLISLKVKKKRLKNAKLIFLFSIVLTTTSYLPNKEINTSKKMNETTQNFKKSIESH